MTQITPPAVRDPWEAELPHALNDADNMPAATVAPHPAGLAPPTWTPDDDPDDVALPEPTAPAPMRRARVDAAWDEPEDPSPSGTSVFLGASLLAAGLIGSAWFLVSVVT